MSVDYKSTVFLPRADSFPMRARLPQREPETLRAWEDMDLFAKVREVSEGREKYILHDGPPYANGHLHMGHALNKILKDVINRGMQMLGYDAHYVPGWDCHGLPIEWKVEEGYRAQGRDKDKVPVTEFRRECREFADKWIGIQIEEFKRLGVLGNWEKPYTTMSYDAEAQIVRELGKFLVGGGLYRGARPVLWSVAEKTALADAEVEYHDHTSHTIWVRFPVVQAGAPALDGARILIWTTTPWTIPGNRAVAFSPNSTYVVIQVKAAGENDLVVPGERLAVAKDLLEQVAHDAKLTDYEVVAELSAAELEGTVCAHPLRGQGYEFDVPVLPGDFVTMEQGTGFVHVGPGHGTDDWLLARKHGLEIPENVDDDSVFRDNVPLFAGTRIYKPDGKEGDANARIIEVLKGAGALMQQGRQRHSYPHSWRSKAPLIHRVTPQWFISMDTNGLRDKALAAIDETDFYPPAGKARLRSMIETRPDWCVSRQRWWGVPLPLFVDRKTGEPLRDPAVIERIAQAFEQEGGDAWFDSDPKRFLGDDYDPADYEQVRDIVEVWFDSGSTHAFVLEARPELKWPASLYLEGSDQHRGWFHTSLLESAGTRGRAPFDGVLTHGFVLDAKGHKMSKSLGNVIAPQDVMSEKGADILRLWVVASDYSEDLRIGEEILRYQVDAYRRLRNTLRYLIGNLADFAGEERLPESEMPELERWVLHRMAELDSVVREGCRRYDYMTIYRELYHFCAVDLSAFYFDVRKDSLYCDRPDSTRRRACRTVLDKLFDCLTAWLAPITCFTAEEAWWARGGGPEESVHLRTFPEVPAGWRDAGLQAKWDKVRRVRRVVTGALELERAEKRIGSSLQAHPTVHIADSELAEAVADVDLAEICITSAVTVSGEPAPAGAFTLDDVPGVAVVPELAEGSKCQRCWQVLPDVGRDAAAPDTCGRCADAVKHLGVAVG
ncbi:isoleucine--tRNA ligase [Ferruginivarius sediminum]|uniref:Isoleucine--tRNA ligase n=1 Tax=Ferruginivarius sediminum TaxID=2661937 RepID=A0A369T8K3_9PROT|nr:isoleucine--tRNA ligase [Ferruginivarius sediminum]RDD60507.1 isoleucine--tRNA ligase [Ferruginivarius sediminum]